MGSESHKIQNYISFENSSLSFLEHLNRARTKSFHCLSNDTNLNRELQKIYFFQAILIEIPNCNSRPWIPNFSPLILASTRLKESIHLALCGSYSSAYDSLRSFLELSLLT